MPQPDLGPPLLHAAKLAGVMPGECVYVGHAYLERPLDLLGWLGAGSRA